MARERISRFLSQWVIPGSASFEPVRPVVDEAFVLSAEDEALLGDQAADHFPHEAMEGLQKDVDDLIAQIFPNPKTQAIGLGLPSLEWRQYMPQTASDQNLASLSHPFVTISKEQPDQGPEKVEIGFDFTDEENFGRLNYTYEDGECTIITTVRNSFGETITETDTLKKPVAHVLRMIKLYEALGFIQNERGYRRGMPIHPYHEHVSSIEE